jgi:hypothetical protein
MKGNERDRQTDSHVNVVSVRDRQRDAFVVGMSEGKKLLARFRRKFEGKIEGDCKEIEWAVLGLCICIFCCVFHAFM